MFNLGEVDFFINEFALNHLNVLNKKHNISNLTKLCKEEDIICIKRSMPTDLNIIFQTVGDQKFLYISTCLVAEIMLK